ncbi:MAG: hypothetical protein H6733_17530 [Alphaproteobacteria bacterium]|nr:hypothetical protein [Alphaproteobacteria bacterium]
MSVLDRVEAAVRRAAARGQHPVVVFDVDSTLFSTQERHRRILVAFAHDRGDPDLVALADRTPAAAFGWSVDGPLRAAGVGDAATWAELHAYWADRFFDDAYCDLDLPMPGAVAFVHRVVQAGALAVYLTGRTADTMTAGTVRLLRRWGLPLHDGRAMLVMKPTAAMADAAFKRGALARIGRLGTVVATFDNEPAHANTFAEVFPDALSVWLATVWSPGAPAVAPEVVRLDGFDTTTSDVTSPR